MDQLKNRYNLAHSRTRSSVERMFGVWKRRFPCLKFGLRCKLPTIMSTIVATAVLHNIAMDIQEPDFEGEGDVFDSQHHVMEESWSFPPNAMGNAIRRTIVQQHFQ